MRAHLSLLMVLILVLFGCELQTSATLPEIDSTLDGIINCEPSEDVNCDGIVDNFDLAIVNDPENFEQIPFRDLRADVNKDGAVDGFDISDISKMINCSSEVFPIADAGDDATVQYIATGRDVYKMKVHDGHLFVGVNQGVAVVFKL